MMKKASFVFLILLFFLFLFVTVGHATTYYVDPDAADDSGTGLSTATAWKHIPGSYQTNNSGPLFTTVGESGCGWQKLSAGDVIKIVPRATNITNKLVIDQVWYNSGTSGNPIKIERAPELGTGGQVIFNGYGRTLAEWDAFVYIHNRNYIAIDGKGTVDIGGGVLEQGIKIQNSTNRGLVAEGQDQSTNKMLGLVVRDVKLHSSAKFNVVMQCQDNFLLENVEVDGNRADTDSSGGIMVGGNTYSCSNGTLRNCKSYRNGAATGNQPGGTNARIGFWLTNSTNILYENCEAYDNKGDGFDTGVDGSPPSIVSNNIIFHNCRSYNNRGDGFGANLDNIAASTTAKYFYVNCIAHDNVDIGWNIYNGADAYLYNCVAANNPRAFYFDFDSNLMTGGRHTKITAKNSIAYNSSTRTFEVSHATYSGSQLLDVTLDYNLYDKGSGGDMLMAWDYGNPAGKAYNYSTAPDIRDWRTEHGQDANSNDSAPLPNGQNKHAYFVGPTSGDFHLQGGSDAINAGVNLTSITSNPALWPYVSGNPLTTDDKDGNARLSSGYWDVGAYVGSPTVHTLTLTKSGSGNGTVTSSPSGINCGSTCSAQYTSGTTVTLSAVPDGSSTFASWSGCDSVNGTQCTVTMSSNRNPTVTFTSSGPYTLTVTKAGSGNGTVTSSPSGINCGSTCSASYSSGTTVTLSAVPDGSSNFTGWSGAGCSGTGTCVVTMNSSQTVSATFVLPSGGVYYVDPASGNDANDGTTRSTAWRHLPGSWDQAGSGYLGGSGWTRIQAGNIIRIKPGTTISNKLYIDSTYYDSGAVGQPIKILRDTDWPGASGQVLFDGTSQVIPDNDAMIFIISRNYIQIDGQGTAGSEAGIKIRKSSKYGLVAQGSDESSKMVGLTLKDIKFQNNGWWNLVLTRQDSFLVENVEVNGNQKDTESSGGILVGGNPYSCSNGIFRNCQSYNNGSTPGTQQGGGARFGFWIMNSTNITLDKCTAYNNEGSGFVISPAGASPTVAWNNIKLTNCLAYNNANGFTTTHYDTASGGNAYFTNCISRNNASKGWLVDSGAHATLYNCVASRNGVTGAYLDTSAGVFTTRDTIATIKNSIFYGNTTNSIYAHNCQDLQVVMDYNLFDKGTTGGTTMIQWDDAAGRETYHKVYYFSTNDTQNIIAWRADQGQDAHSYDSTELGKHAYFVGSTDLHLQSASDAINVGMDLSSVWPSEIAMTDMDGNTRPAGSGWDMGAYEYGS